MDTERILAAEVGKALRRLRIATRLSQVELARRLHINPSRISKYERGEVSPPRVVLQAILHELHEELESDDTPDVATFLSRLGLTPAEYDTGRSKTYLHQDMLTGLREARDVKEINWWLANKVVKSRRGRRHSLPDLDVLHANLSQLFTSTRDAGLTYPGRPRMLNTSIHLPRDGFRLRLDYPFLHWLTKGYFGAGPRLTGGKIVPQKLWPIEIFQMLLKPITESDDEKAPLAGSILQSYEQTDIAFHEQMKKKQWQYLDIVPLSAIRELVRTGKPSPDSSLNYLGITRLSREMVRHLLSEMVFRLWLYEDTYHLALLDDINHETDGAVRLLSQHLTEHFWTVMPGTDGQLNLIVTEWPVAADGMQQAVHHHIDDMTIIKPFLEPFCELVRKMSPKKLMTAKETVTKRIVAELR